MIKKNTNNKLNKVQIQIKVKSVDKLSLDLNYFDIFQVQ